ncbi:MATE family efflux transporter [Metamycoplasma phocicerebrale]|uniref:Probable multidrug resistance protein NorM n=1 Tax=Metamycoplasma phocicerebrale TaxID=142649 RepID=A0A3Q9VA23_9BACT|nr:MATE family efflux transporter [Metamycoplasma phocicerebrale]AZZ65360.1 MATE family efflux transporter [Metamycoplasma phocicerebrale]
MQESVIKHKKKHYFRRFLPQSKYDWKIYFSKTWPIIIGEILFCLNGFLDNFMVSHIPSGIDALTYANTYTGIIYTIFFAIQGIAGMFVGQYYGKKDYKKVNQIMNLRIWMYLFISLTFAIICWSTPTNLIQFIGGKNINGVALNESRMYLMLISVSWVITSFNFNTNMQLNETGHSNLAFVSACLTLLSNATINAISLYGFKGHAYYAAFGSIISAFVCLASDSFLTYYKDRPIFINIFKIYRITKPVAKQLLRRIPAMLITIAAMITLPMRMIIWSRAFPDDLINGSGIRAAWMGINAVTILGLVESLASIASAITSACSSNVSYFVASNLGKNNFEEAEKHAFALKGFHAIMGLTMSTIMVGVVFGIAYSPATSRGAQEAVVSNIYFYLDRGLFGNILESKQTKYWIDSNILEKAKIVYNSQFHVWSNGIPNKNELNIFINNEDIQNLIKDMKLKIGLSFRQIFLYTCFTFICINPVWCWFYTTAALPSAGGRNMIGSLTMLGAHWLSFIWLITLTFGIIIPLRSKNTFISLEVAYCLFFMIDFIRWLIFEIVTAKTNWKRNITEESEKIIIKKDTI